jgi:hypothetical protein
MDCYLQGHRLGHHHLWAGTKGKTNQAQPGQLLGWWKERVVEEHPGHPWVLEQATGTSDHKTHHGPDSRVSHHLTPYSILCDSPRHPRPNVTFSRDSQVGVPKLSRNCPGWSPRTLGAHNSRLRSLIATRSEPNL